MGRIGGAGTSLVLGVLALGASACGDGVALKNGPPRVTWVAVEALAGDRAALTLWVQDPEGDAVDVGISWSGGGAGGEIALAPGSAPLLGLPTQAGLNDDEGAPHRVTWDLTGVPEGAIELSIDTDDRPYDDDAGDTWRVTLDPRTTVGPLATE